MPENTNYEVENQIEENEVDADDNRDLYLLAGGAALAGAGAYALLTKAVVPGMKKAACWIKDHIPFKKKMTDVEEVPKAEESAKKKN